jgi:hypothetical protein
LKGVTILPGASEWDLDGPPSLRLEIRSLSDRRTKDGIAERYSETNCNNNFAPFTHKTGDRCDAAF